MIFTLILSFAVSIVTSILNILPLSDGFPSEVDSAFAYIGSYMSIFDVIVPIETIGTIVVLVIYFELALFAFKALKWIVSYLPFVGGKA